mmetsp:Transcript_53939/g.157408  ORF Transcript_53939/g.157408 Transcript_53939/m.157408 type:complete len:294 (+) Transcript_53939:1-882(+)
MEAMLAPPPRPSASVCRHQPAARIAAEDDMPHSPPGQGTQCGPIPRACENPLLKALRANDIELVMASIKEDETLVYSPLLTGQGCEPPVLVALKEDCSASILSCLLRAGASVCDVGPSGLTALEVVAKAKRAQLETLPNAPDAESPWTPCQDLGGFDVQSQVFGGIPGWGPQSGVPLELRELASARDDEDRRCACARLLLAHGDGMSRAGAAAVAAQAAEERGDMKLAGLIRYWEELKAASYLRQLRSRRERLCSPALLECPHDIWELIFEALAPREATLDSGNQHLAAAPPV